MVNDTEAGLWVSIFLQQQLGHYTVSSGHGQVRRFFNTGVVICVSTSSCMPVGVNAGTTCARCALKCNGPKAIAGQLKGH